MDREGGIGFNYEVFENGIWKCGMEEEESMSCYDYI